MAWEARGTRHYYYRSKRINGEVKKEYVGRGFAAQLAAMRDELMRRQRDREREELRALRAAVQPALLLMEDLADGERMLIQAELLSDGCYQHKGTWRKRNGK